MLISIGLIAIGFALLVKGGDFLVEGSSAFAKKIGIPDFIIGLTLVAFGTSAPELVVNVVASLQGKSEIAFANIMGSNLANIMLILGLAGMVRALEVRRSFLTIKLPISVLCVVALIGLIYLPIGPTPTLSRLDGILLLAGFAAFLIYLSRPDKAREIPKEKPPKFNLLKDIFFCGLGLIFLPAGGKLVVDSAVKLASAVGVSETLVGILVVAIGTSLPELATSVVAARKGHSDIAVGNIIGSNIFNILLILGVSSVIRPMAYNPAMNTEAVLIIIASVVLAIFMVTGRKNHMDRWEAGIMFLGYIAYAAYCFWRG